MGQTRPGRANSRTSHVRFSNRPFGVKHFQTIRRCGVDDYSLHSVASRPANVGDKLVTTDFAKSITPGFAAVGKPGVAVCLLPGTEVAFEDDVQYDRAFSMMGKARVGHKVARFRQINMKDPIVHHDALEFPGGKIVLVTRLTPGQRATVLQLPAQPMTMSETKTEKRRRLRQLSIRAIRDMMVGRRVEAAYWGLFRGPVKKQTSPAKK